MHPCILHLAAFEVEYFLPTFPEVTLISRSELIFMSYIQLQNSWCVWMMTFSLYLFFIKFYDEYCLGEWSGVASKVGGQRKGQISVNQLHFLATCFYGHLLHFNIFQSCQVVSVLLGPDRRGRIVRDYLDTFSTSPAAQQRICGVQFWQFQTQQGWSQVPLGNLIWF